MDPNEVVIALTRRPFEPFRLHLTDDSSYEVSHPDQAILSRRAIHIGVGGNGSKIHQRIVVCSLVHVTRLEPVETD